MIGRSGGEGTKRQPNVAITSAVRRKLTIYNCSNRNYSLLSEGLKKLTFKAVLRRPSIQLYEKRGEKVITGLYKVYADEKYNVELMLLSPEYRRYQNGPERRRNIIDFIAGMMDSYAIQEYERYFGSGELEKLYFNNPI